MQQRQPVLGLIGVHFNLVADGSHARRHVLPNAVYAHYKRCGSLVLPTDPTAWPKVTISPILIFKRPGFRTLFDGYAAAFSICKLDTCKGFGPPHHDHHHGDASHDKAGNSHVEM